MLKWQLVIGWLYPKAIGRLYQHSGSHPSVAGESSFEAAISFLVLQDFERTCFPYILCMLCRTPFSGTRPVPSHGEPRCETFLLPCRVKTSFALDDYSTCAMIDMFRDMKGAHGQQACSQSRYPGPRCYYRRGDRPTSQSIPHDGAFRPLPSTSFPAADHADRPLFFWRFSFVHQLLNSCYILAEESPPTTVEILHALDAVKGEDIHLRKAIHEGQQRSFGVLKILQIVAVFICTHVYSAVPCRDTYI